MLTWDPRSCDKPQTDTLAPRFCGQRGDLTSFFRSSSGRPTHPYTSARSPDSSSHRRTPSAAQGRGQSLGLGKVFTFYFKENIINGHACFQDKTRIGFCVPRLETPFSSQDWLSRHLGSGGCQAGGHPPHTPVTARIFREEGLSSPTCIAVGAQTGQVQGTAGRGGQGQRVGAWTLPAAQPSLKCGFLELAGGQ